MNHSFNIDIASEVGVEAAIIFENILYWVVKNAANQENVRDGVAWVYNSRAAWCDIFPYLGEKQIRNAIERLLGAGFITRDTFSFGSMNRTYWYTLAERAKQFVPKGPNLGSGQKGQTKTVINNSINSTPPKAPKGPCGWEEDSGFMSVMEAYQKLNPSRVNPAKAWAVWQEHSLSGHSERILGALPSFSALDQWKREGARYIPNFAKWLADGAWRTTKIAVQVTAEELEERKRVHSAGMSALARVESCRRLKSEPEASDVQAVAKMREQQARYGNASA
ncbi:hypothetical protein [Agrobacterium tumefaciens]|uniref:hypothetical protein n=1 Tax=Agrobacterium tumefaciens TaxID=358 RepID=UPI00047046F5